MPGWNELREHKHPDVDVTLDAENNVLLRVTSELAADGQEIVLDRDQAQALRFELGQLIELGAPATSLGRSELGRPDDE